MAMFKGCDSNFEVNNENKMLQMAQL